MDEEPGLEELEALEKQPVDTPKGTVLITLLYALVAAVLWAYMFFDMVRMGGALRGG